ncbi:MAG: hypothetical protein WC197_02560 [Candidatus Gastranaerophilaceae bacterium]
MDKNPLINKVLQMHQYKIQSKPMEKKNNTFVFNNTGIATATTLTGASIIGGMTIAKQCKNIKMKFVVFAKNMFKEIAKNSKESEMIHSFYKLGKLSSYVGILKVTKNIKESTQTDESLKNCINYFNNQVRNMKIKFTASMIKNILFKSILGAIAGLAVGLSIIGIRNHSDNKNKKNESI